MGFKGEGFGGNKDIAIYEASVVTYIWYIVYRWSAVIQHTNKPYEDSHACLLTRRAIITPSPSSPLYRPHVLLSQNTTVATHSSTYVMYK